jgi:hypothetical protein
MTPLGLNSNNRRAGARRFTKVIARSGSRLIGAKKERPQRRMDRAHQAARQTAERRAERIADLDFYFQPRPCGERRPRKQRYK